MVGSVAYPVGDLGQFEAAGKFWALAMTGASVLSLLFLLRSIPREPESFWRFVGIIGAVSSGIGAVSGTIKLLS